MVAYLFLSIDGYRTFFRARCVFENAALVGLTRFARVRIHHRSEDRPWSGIACQHDHDFRCATDQDETRRRPRLH